MSTASRSITTPVTAELLRGALRVERTASGVRPHRLPAWALDQAHDPQLAMAQAQPSGVRIAVVTTATTIELIALATRYGFRGMPARPAGVVDLVVDGRLAGQARLASATTVTIDPTTGVTETAEAEPSSIVFDALPAGVKPVEIWLPHTAAGNAAEVAAGKLTLTVIREHLARIVRERGVDDPHLHHVDGLDLYGPADAHDLPLPDGLHPDTATHRLMGERFAAQVLAGRGH